MHVPRLLLVLVASCVIAAAGVLAQTERQQLLQNILNVDGAPQLDFRRDSLLSRILIPRQPDTANSTAVRHAIIERLQSTGHKWHIETPSFIADTPIGKKNMTNIVATRDPGAARRLVVAAHYDSKYYPPESGWAHFVGATDSAVPCAVLVDTAIALDALLDAYTERQKSARLNRTGLRDDVTLQLVFFDGEEAYKYWSKSDSVYGSRDLAEQWSTSWLLGTYHGGAVPAREIDLIDHLVLVDLIGVAEPRIASYYESTRWVYDIFKRAEESIRSTGLLAAPGNTQPPQIFTGDTGTARISDDHVPFLERGVPIVHVIPWPFPRVWHKIEVRAC